jgi:hypothetical protein
VRYVALSTVVVLVILSPVLAFAGADRFISTVPSNIRQPNSRQRFLAALPSLSTGDLLSACGRGRYRDSKTHQCRGRADVTR